jgi:Glu-tRNA(Gln) amidotransferase subunit E-like FAD-binding protein
MEKDIGLRIGLEIHQQLDTKKLFCSCPSLAKEKAKPDLIIKRNLFAISGELGDIDIAALYEQEKSRNHFYYFYNDCCCLVELDEKPPEPINQEALEIALQICMLLNAEILPLTQVMRKIVIDGSDVSGFQRTLLLARNGVLDYEFEGQKKTIRIDTICLEEEAAKKIKEDGQNVYWSLDRYGIPLVEITTESSIKSPEEAKVVALAIGELLRACKVKRGLGTIRQDLNVSVRGGARTEIKGVQEPKLIPVVLKNEIEYQLEEIKKGKKLSESVKKANEDGSLTFLRPLPTSARMYPETDLPLIKIEKSLLEKIRKSLPKTIQQLREEIGIENVELAEGIVKKKERLEIWQSLQHMLRDKETKLLLANLLVNTARELSRELKQDEEEILERARQALPKLIDAVNKNKITKQAAKEVFVVAIKEKTEEKAIDGLIEKFKIMSRQELEEKILQLSKSIDKKYLMQEAIKRFKLNADVKTIVEIVNKILAIG